MDDERTMEQRGVILETFIPVTRFALMKALLEDAASHGDAADLGVFFRFLGQWRHQEHFERLVRLKECYMPFSPDRDTLRVTAYSDEELMVLQARLVGDIRAMLERANYTLIDEAEQNRLLSTHSAHGLELKVDRDEYDEILIFYRGAGEEVLVKRDWETLFRKRVVTVPIFKRLFLVLKLKTPEQRIQEIMAGKRVGEARARKLLEQRRKPFPKVDGGKRIYLKLFKNIPQEDLEMMFPNTQVRFRMYDKVKLGMTAGGGTAAGVGGAASKAMAAVATANPLALASAIFGIVAVVSRQVMSFFNTRNRYMLALSKRLYFHSLADNRGALTLLSDRGEQEDIKEELLLYYFLWRRPVARGELHAVDARIESFLADNYGVKVDFDVEDAVQRLQRDGLLRDDEAGMLRVLSPGDACRLLEDKWRERIADMGRLEACGREPVAD